MSNILSGHSELPQGISTNNVEGNRIPESELQQQIKDYKENVLNTIYNHYKERGYTNTANNLIEKITGEKWEIEEQLKEAKDIIKSLTFDFAVKMQEAKEKIKLLKFEGENYRDASAIDLREIHELKEQNKLLKSQIKDHLSSIDSLNKIIQDK